MILQLIEHIWNIDRIIMKYMLLQLIEHIWNIDMENFNCRSTGMYIAWLVELVDVWENFRQSWVSKLINKRVGFLQTPCNILALYCIHCTTLMKSYFMIYLLFINLKSYLAKLCSLYTFLMHFLKALPHFPAPIIFPLPL